MIPEGSQRRFWAMVDQEKHDQCWSWTGERDPRGYGKIRINYRRWLAHRVSLVIATGQNPGATTYALHSCDNPSCVNPSHLRWGTARENTADMHSRGRRGRTENPGEANGRATLTEQEVRAIRDDGRPLMKIAAAFGTSKGTVCNIRARRTWRHLED